MVRVNGRLRFGMVLGLGCGSLYQHNGWYGQKSCPLYTVCIVSGRHVYLILSCI